jgi:dihydrofolate synthase/folylpolyglutamate synthase
LIAVVGVMRDKDVRGILAQLEPVVDEVVVTAARSSRAMDVDDLAAVACEVFDDSRVVVRRGLPDAIEAAIALATDADADSDQVSGAGVVITGSVALVGQARTFFGRDPQ